MYLHIASPQLEEASTLAKERGVATSVHAGKHNGATPHTHGTGRKVRHVGIEACVGHNHTQVVGV